MVQVEISEIIHAPKERVYAINANFSNWPKIYPWVKSVRLISEQGNERILEAVVTNKGKEQVVHLTQSLSPNRIEETQRRKRATAIKINYAYETVPEGTRLLITASLEPRANTILYRSATFLLRRRLVNMLIRYVRSSLELEKKAAEAK
ncbi:MAG: SRPBCC family protein [Candidatus Bathyarchaeia archaeon]